MRLYGTLGKPGPGERSCPGAPPTARHAHARRRRQRRRPVRKPLASRPSIPPRERLAGVPGPGPAVPGPVVVGRPVVPRFVKLLIVRRPCGLLANLEILFNRPMLSTSSAAPRLGAASPMVPGQGPGYASETKWNSRPVVARLQQGGGRWSRWEVAANASRLDCFPVRRRGYSAGPGRQLRTPHHLVDGHVNVITYSTTATGQSLPLVPSREG